VCYFKPLAAFRGKHLILNKSVIASGSEAIQLNIIFYKGYKK